MTRDRNGKAFKKVPIPTFLIYIYLFIFNNICRENVNKLASNKRRMIKKSYKLRMLMIEEFFHTKGCQINKCFTPTLRL